MAGGEDTEWEGSVWVQGEPLPSGPGEHVLSEGSSGRKVWKSRDSAGKLLAVGSTLLLETLVTAGHRRADPGAWEMNAEHW